MESGFSPSLSVSLSCHPDVEQSAILSIEVDVRRQPDGQLGLHFRATGAMDRIAWPGESPSGNGPWHRRDGLWQHSCFEAFAMIPGEAAYFETNFATVGEWAAYAFLDRRIGMRAADDIDIVAGNWRVAPRHADLDVLLDVPAHYRDVDWLVGLSAVIETRDGAKSYWAIRHPPGKPDFHHPDCFALKLPAASGA